MLSLSKLVGKCEVYRYKREYKIKYHWSSGPNIISVKILVQTEAQSMDLFGIKDLENVIKKRSQDEIILD